MIGRDFGYVAERAQWRYWGPGGERYGLPYPGAARRVPARATRRRRSPRSTLLRDAAAGERRRDARRALLDGRAAGPLPGAARAADDRARRRAQPARGARARRRRSATMGYLPGDDRRVRHARRQGHRAAWSRRCAARIDRWFVATLPGPRGARAPTRCATRSLRGGRRRRARSARSTTSTPRSPRRGTRRAKLIESSFSDRS